MALSSLVSRRNAPTTDNSTTKTSATGKLRYCDVMLIQLIGGEEDIVSAVRFPWRDPSMVIAYRTLWFPGS